MEKSKHNTYTEELGDKLDKKIRIAASDPTLQDKIFINIKPGEDKIYWHIRFNIQLDASTVSCNTMSVKDTEGYVMRTVITYSNERNLIVVSPHDSYEQNRFYILSISRDVKSLAGNNMKTEVNIIFKLKNNQISEYNILSPNVKIPESKPRPANYDELQLLKSSSSTRNQPEVDTDDAQATITPNTTAKTVQPAKNHYQDKLPFADMKVNILLGVFGVLLTILSIFTGEKLYIMVSMAICGVGITHIIVQLNTRKIKTVLRYNLGVMQYNKGNYEKSLKLFEKSVFYQDDNSLAHHAIKKSKEYISKLQNNIAT